MLTTATLRALANTSSYTKGLTYHRQNAVGKITQSGRIFAARVTGSYNYRVTLDLADDTAPEFTCSCPYNFDGICKHAVALGVAVINQFDLTKLPAPLPTLTEAWGQASAALKEDFLLRLLHRDAATARAFAQAVVKAATDSRKTQKGGKQTATDLAEALAAMRFDESLADEIDDQPDDYDDEDEGYDDYESDYDQDRLDQMRAVAEEHVAAVLRPAAERLTTRLRAGHVAATLAEWHATITALDTVEEPEYDEFDLFADDYPEHLVLTWQQELAAAGWLAVLSTSALPTTERKTVQVWLTQVLSANAPEPEPEVAAGWQAVLLALAATEEKLAAQLPALLKKAAWLPAEARAAVLLRVARTTHDDSLWATTAEPLADTDAAVATQLLHFYRNANDKENHRRAAARALAAFPAQFHAYILEHFSPTHADGLHLDALRYRCRTTASLADYDELAAQLTAPQLRKFADDLSRERNNTDAHARFVGEILNRQRRPDDLLAYLLRLDWFALPDAVLALLALVAPQRPEASLDAVAARIEAAMEAKPMPYKLTPQRGARLYNQLTAWLTVLHRQAELREQVRTIATFLLERYATLHLLKKALREANLLEAAPAHLPAAAADHAPKRRPGRPPKLR